MRQYFKEDLMELFYLIKTNRPFAFMRFADGEIGVMKGCAVNGSDKWTSPNKRTRLGEALLEAISRTDSNIYYGISCQCCDLEGRNYLLQHIKNDKSNVTFSNLFVNGNYKLFKEQLHSLNKPVYVVANESAIFQNFPLPILGFVPVPDDCVNYWESNSEGVKQALSDAFKSIKGELFLIAAGPMSEAIIDYLWSINPNNQYIDVGSAVAEYIHGYPIRDFAYPTSPYYNKNCVF